MVELPIRGMSTERLTKEHILDRMREAIRTSANGRAPGSTTFEKRWGVPQGKVDEYWDNHSELILAAGGTPNEPKRKIPDEELFRDYAKVCRREGKIPTQKRLRFLTRELGTRTYKVEKPDGYPAFKVRFREWCRTKSPEYDDILGFTGWERKSFGTRTRVTTQVSQIATVPYLYLPVGLVHLSELASNRLPPELEGGEPAHSLFEQKCADAFCSLGFQLRRLGQGHGRKADFLAIARAQGFGVIIDAKARADGFVLGTEDRKLAEYANNHSADLRREGIDRIYLCVVSSSFREKDIAALRKALTGTDIHGWSMWTADALMATVNRSIEERADFSLAILEPKFRLNSII